MKKRHGGRQVFIAFQKWFKNRCPENREFQQKLVVSVECKNGLIKTIPWTENPRKNKEKSILVNPCLRFTKTTDFFYTQILGFQGRGS